MIENRTILGNILHNERGLKMLFFHLGKNGQDISFKRRKELLQEVKHNSKILEHVKEDLYMEDNILQDLELLGRYPEGSEEYKKVYDRVINVGEYKNVMLKKI